MNDGTYEGILNQDDVQEYFNGDDARPFYPERAERITRDRTHYDGCHRVHPECALVKVTELEKELESETKWAKQYHDDWIAARAELERVKAEIRRRETGGTSSVAEINAIHELKREKAEVERGELHADNRSMLILKIGLRASRLHDLFKCANAAKRQMRRERDAAHQSRNRIVWLVRRYCALNQMNLAFFLDSEKLLRDARINLDAANKRAEQAEFELVEAQSRLIAGGVYEKLDSVNYWKTRAEQAEAQRDAAILKRDAAIKRAQISEAGRAEAEADARALAQRP